MFGLTIKVWRFQKKFLNTKDYNKCTKNWVEGFRSCHIHPLVTKPVKGNFIIALIDTSIGIRFC